MLFFRQRTRDSCRFDAVNNYLQANILHGAVAKTYFQSYKKKHPFAVFTLTHNHDQENFLTFLLEQLTGKRHRIVDADVRATLLATKNVPSFLVYSSTHCWCVLRTLDNEYYELDGLKVNTIHIPYSRVEHLFTTYHCIIS